MYKNTHLDRDTSHLDNLKVKAPAVHTVDYSTPKQSRWLSKDRLWNLIFWFGMSGGITLAFSVSDKAQAQYKLGTILIWLTILGVPLLVRYFSKTTFIKDKLFLNKEDELLNAEKDTPNAVLTVISTVVLTAITGAILDKNFKDMSDIASSFIIFSVFFGVPSLFFIFKNCPIAILFNLEFLKKNIEWGSNNSYKANKWRSNTAQVSKEHNYPNYISDPKYRYMPFNIYNSNR